MAEYLVVEFSEDDGTQTVEVVPSTWLDVAKGTCAWPSLRGGFLARKMSPPCPEWPMYRAKRLFTTRDYSQATRHRNHLMDSSAYSTTDDERPRKRFFPSFYVDPDAIIPASQVAPRPASISKGGKSGFSLTSIPASNEIPVGDNSDSSEEEGLTPPTSFTTAYDQTQTKLPNKQQTPEEFSQVLDVLSDLSKKVDGLTTQLVLLRREIRGTLGATANQSFDCVLPLSAKEELDNINVKLADKQIFKEFVRIISATEGISMPSFLRNLLRRIFSSGMAASLSWSGRGETIGLKGSRIFEAISRVVTSRFSDTETDLKSVLKDHLKRATQKHKHINKQTQ